MRQRSPATTRTCVSIPMGLATSAMRVLPNVGVRCRPAPQSRETRSEEHTSELQSRLHLVCRLLLEKKNNNPAPSSAEQAAVPSSTVPAAHTAPVTSVPTSLSAPASACYPACSAPTDRHSTPDPHHT